MIDLQACYASAVARALEEDDAAHDITTEATVPADARGRARLLTKEACVISGLEAVRAAFTQCDPDVKVVPHVNDGDETGSGSLIATIEGRLRPILAAERTALNFVSRLSGIATLTRAFVRLAGPDCLVLDTRKTTPGLRVIEKDAVYHGGGAPHRLSLSHKILIKDNHIAAAGSLTAAVRAALEVGLPEVEVECDTLEQVREAIAAGADQLLLDNMDLPALKAAIAEAARAEVWTEASGGITLENVAQIAATGVDAVSVGALTHSARAIDLSLEIETE